MLFRSGCPAGHVDCGKCSSPEDKLIISEVGKGAGANKWVEIYNPTDHAIDLDSAKKYYLMGFNDGATSLPYFPQKLGANSANCANKVYDNDGNVLPTMADGSNNPCISKMIPPRGLYILCNKNADSTTLSDKCHHENAGLGVNFDGDDFLVLAQLRFQDLTTGPTDEQCTPSTEDTTCTLTPTNTDTETGGSCAVDAGSGVCAYSDAEPRAFVSLECPASGDTILKDPNGAVLPGAAMDAFGVCGAGASQWSPHTANYRKYQVVEPSSKYRAWEWTQVAGWAMSEA